jgi:hypothetical protein
VTRRHVRAAAALVTLTLALGGAARAEDPAPEDPPLCRSAITARPQQSALDALAEAEQDASRRANEAQRAAAKLMRKHIGDGTQGGLAASTAAEALLRKQADARREGKVLCHCRQRRGDSNRQDCEYLYPERLQ